MTRAKTDNRPGGGRPLGRWAAVAVLIVCGVAPGCVKRTIAIRSEPPGARVYYNGEHKGLTPLEFEFFFYGQPEITLIHPGDTRSEMPIGYEIHKEIYSIRAPWYQWPVLDFVADVLLPFTIHDRRDLGTVALEPRQTVPTGELIDRARELKRELHPTSQADDAP